MDPRYNYPTDTPLTKEAGFDNWQIQGENGAGTDSLDGKYTATGVIGNMAFRALGRLVVQSKKALKPKPFSLAVHFNGPHP